MTFDAYLTGLAERLETSPYRVQRDVALGDGESAPLTAHRTSFSWKGLVGLSHHIVVTAKEDPTPADFTALFDASFALGKRVNKVPLLRGLQFGYLVVPVIAATSYDPEVLAWVQARPAKHFSLFEFPVLIDLSASEAHYYAQTAVWGAAYFSDLRKIVETWVAPPTR